MLVIAEVLVTYTYRNYFTDIYEHRPAVFWIWSVPYKIAIFAAYAGIWLSRSRRANISWLVIGLLLFAVPYAQYQYIQAAIAHFYGYR